MHLLLQGIGGAQEDDIQKKIGGYLGYPDAGAVKKISQKNINKDGEGDKQKDKP